jgi:serine-type D-Ala-D-Ala carboxypeptidase/endopeptidase
MKLSLGMLLSSLIILSCISSIFIIFFKQQQVIAYSKNSKQQPSFVTTTNSLGKELSNLLLDQMKQIVFKYLSKGTSISNSSIPISMVLGVVSPNGTQVSGYGNLSKANFW